MCVHAGNEVVTDCIMPTGYGTLSVGHVSSFLKDTTTLSGRNVAHLMNYSLLLASFPRCIRFDDKRIVSGAYDG